MSSKSSAPGAPSGFRTPDPLIKSQRGMVVFALVDQQKPCSGIITAHYVIPGRMPSEATLRLTGL
jgi:hypothetical protein